MPTKTKTNSERYFEAVGRRKTATARVRVTPATKESITVNDKSLNDYFQTDDRQLIVKSAQTAAGIEQKFAITVKVQS
jgi:small subunit ribosomal protein S9